MDSSKKFPAGSFDGLSCEAEDSRNPIPPTPQPKGGTKVGMALCMNSFSER